MRLFENDVFNLADIARDVAAQTPERIAVVEPDGRHARDGTRTYQRYTYRQLSRDAEGVAVGLREIGVAERTRTVFMAPPSYRAAVLGVALTRVGATTIWIDPAVGYRNVGERLRRLSPEAFVGIPLAHVARAVFGWGPRIRQKLILVGGGSMPGFHSVESLRRGAPPRPEQPDVGPADPAAVLYTTGSTGPAKPVLYQHRQLTQLYRTVHQSWRFADLAQPPVDLAAFPAFTFIALSAGGTVVVPPIDFARQGPADADPGALLEVINDCRVTSMFASPVLLENVARHVATHGTRAPTLRRVIGGGAPIVPSRLEALLDALDDGGEVLANYGATEVLPATELGVRESLEDTWSRTERGAGVCVGRPLAGVELRIAPITETPIRDLGSLAWLPAGEIGEIVIGSRHASPAYLGDADNTRFHKIEGSDGIVWHRIRDAGYLDPSGRLWYCGRVGQRVQTEHGTLYPLQVEPIFDRHSEVRRSALVGVDVGHQTLPVMCIEAARRLRGSEAERLRGELLKLAASQATTAAIRTVLFVRRLPVDPRHNSKIDRPALKSWATGKLRRPRARSQRWRFRFGAAGEAA